MQQVEDFLHSLPPHLWLIYHVNLKAMQVSSMVGIATFVLKAPLLIKPVNKYIVSSNDSNKINKYVNMRQLRKYLYQSFICAGISGICVTVYNLFILDNDLLEDRV
eukprot:334329_1